jgi:uncharacterized protein (DUF169 family)
VKEVIMKAKKMDYSIFEKFNFERKPVGIKYSLTKPEGIKPLKKSLAICEMFAEAYTSRPFYATEKTIECGEHIVGLKEFPPAMYSGQMGPSFSMFKNPQSNRRVYDYIRVMPKDSVKYVLHASVDQMNFDPDLLIITANPAQAEIILRASSYSDGKLWSFKGTTCLACSWIYSYPYLSGEINCCISGLGYSMKAREVLPDGLLIITIPANQIPMLIDNLKEMEWEPRWFKLGKKGFVEAVNQLELDVKKTLV